MSVRLAKVQLVCRAFEITRVLKGRLPGGIIRNYTKFPLQNPAFFNQLS
jgi:hypothetical protein